MAYDLKYGAVTVDHDSPNSPLNDTGEPVFIVRAQDQSSLLVLKNYAELNRHMATELEQVFGVFVEWQETHSERVKKSD